MKIRLILMLDWKEVYAINADTEAPTPSGIENEDFDRWQMTELFRGILRVIDPEEKYRLDLTRRPLPELGLPSSTRPVGWGTVK